MHKDFIGYGSPSIRLIEELSELIQALTKMERFGLNNYSPFDETKTSNKEKIIDEISDVRIALKNFETWINTVSDENEQSIIDDFAKRVTKSKELDPEAQNLINDNFWDMV
jgi:NTP pyrophosphatase (non-canonical NTP hydrolase)